MPNPKGSIARSAGARSRLGFLLGAFGFLLAFCGCSGEGGLSGRTPFAGARVCLDANSNFACDPGEPGADTDAEGHFSLPGNRSGTADSILLIQVEEGDLNLLEGRPAENAFPLLNPDPEGKSVTVWSTLAWSRIQAGAAAGPEEGKEQVRNAFGLSADLDEPGERERSLEQLTLGVYVQQYGLTSGAGEEERVRAAAEATYAAASRLNGLLDWYIQAEGAPPPANAGPNPGEVFWVDYDRIPLSAEMTYGIGLDESNLDFKGDCLVPGFAAVPGLCENTGDYIFELVNSVDDLATHFEVGAAAKAGVSVGGFDIVSVSGGFRFLKDTVMYDDRLYIAIRHEEILCGYPISADLAPNYADLFARDYQSFRSYCGDRYLASVTTGGYFFGLIEITLDEDQDIEQERLNLSGKVLGIKVFDKTWTHTAAEISRDYQTSTRVVSNFFAYENSSLSMAEVIDKYDEFLDRLKGSYCQGATANVGCGYLASFASYATATTRAAAPDPVLSTYLPNMRSYETFYSEAEDILDDLAGMIASPENYNIGRDVDQLHQPNGWSRDLLIRVRSGLEGKRDLALSRWSDCFGNIYGCTPGAASINFSDNPTRPTWLDLKLNLPEKKFFFPGDCRELTDLLGLSEDDEYDLYFGGREGATYAADCRYMDTSQPRTYLVLGNTSPGPDQPSYNQVWIATGPGTGVGKMFTRLAVAGGKDPVTGADVLEVTGPQEDYYQTSAVESAMLELLKRTPVLSARASAGGSAVVNLNLEETGLHLGSDPVFELRGNLKGFRYRVNISTDRKNVDLLLEPVPGGAAGAVTEAVVKPVSPILLEHD